jgi:hypothetical protein
MGPGDPLEVGLGLGSGGGVTRGVVAGNGGGTRTPGPFGMIGRGSAAPGLIDGSGDGVGDASSSSSAPGVGGDTAGACATEAGMGKHGVLSKASACA